MGEFLGMFFEKLNNDVKLKLSIIFFGLFMPSLIYYVLLYTDDFLSIDLIKVTIICICINFLFIFSLTCIGMLIRVINFFIRSKFINNYKKINRIYN